MSNIEIDCSQIVTASDKEAAALDAVRSEIAARRWKAEVCGINVGGIHVHTDERTRTNILGAYQEAMEDPDYTVMWKGADGGFISLDAPTIVFIAKAIRSHVQACFNREAEILMQLEAGLPYDIDHGWP